MTAEAHITEGDSLGECWDGGGVRGLCVLREEEGFAADLWLKAGGAFRGGWRAGMAADAPWERLFEEIYIRNVTQEVSVQSAGVLKQRWLIGGRVDGREGNCHAQRLCWA